MKRTAIYSVLILAVTSILFFGKDKKGRNKFLKKIEDSAKGALEDTLKKMDSGEINMQTAKTI